MERQEFVPKGQQSRLYIGAGKKKAHLRQDDGLQGEPR